MISLALAAALTLTPPQNYSARCLIEVAALTGEQAVLTSSEWRDAARAKARALDDISDRLSLSSDEAWREADRYEAQQRDLHENGLITDAEWATVQRQVADTRQSVRDGLTDTRTPSCGFQESHRFLPVFRALARETE